MHHVQLKSEGSASQAASSIGYPTPPLGYPPHQEPRRPNILRGSLCSGYSRRLNMPKTRNRQQYVRRSRVSGCLAGSAYSMIIPPYCPGYKVNCVALCRSCCHPTRHVPMHITNMGMSACYYEITVIERYSALQIRCLLGGRDGCINHRIEVSGIAPLCN